MIPKEADEQFDTFTVIVTVLFAATFVDEAVREDVGEAAKTLIDSTVANNNAEKRDSRNFFILIPPFNL